MGKQIYYDKIIRLIKYKTKFYIYEKEQKHNVITIIQVW